MSYHHGMNKVKAVGRASSPERRFEVIVERELVAPRDGLDDDHAVEGRRDFAVARGASEEVLGEIVPPLHNGSVRGGCRIPHGRRNVHGRGRPEPVPEGVGGGDGGSGRFGHGANETLRGVLGRLRARLCLGSDACTSERGGGD